MVHYDKTFERYERTADGAVTCHFADGMTAVADVLVAADGGGSRVRSQYRPHAERVDTGIKTIAGELSLTAQTRTWLPDRLAGGPNMVMPPTGCGLFTAPHDLGGGAQVTTRLDRWQRRDRRGSTRSCSTTPAAT